MWNFWSKHVLSQRDQTKSRPSIVLPKLQRQDNVFYLMCTNYFRWLRVPCTVRRFRSQRVCHRIMNEAASFACWIRGGGLFYTYLPKSDVYIYLRNKKRVACNCRVNYNGTRNAYKAWGDIANCFTCISMYASHVFHVF